MPSSFQRPQYLSIQEASTHFGERERHANDSSTVSCPTATDLAHCSFVPKKKRRATTSIRWQWQWWAASTSASKPASKSASLARRVFLPPSLPSFFPLTSAERGAVAENRIGRSLRRFARSADVDAAAENDCDGEEDVRSFIQARAPKGRNPTLLAHLEIVFIEDKVATVEFSCASEGSVLSDKSIYRIVLWYCSQ